MTTTDLHIYGASDDLIEVEGSVRDEFDAPYGRNALVAVDAHVPGVQHPVSIRLEVEYDKEGIWRVRPDEGYNLLADGMPEIEIVPARGEDEGNDEWGCPGYSDRAVVRGGFKARLVPA